MNTNNTISKRKTNAFNKDVYLIGQDENGINYWLESPSWDCGWYWGFGYVEAYTNNNNPSKSRDIDSHQHLSGNILDGIVFFTLNDAELHEFKSLVNSFYTHRKEADAAHQTKPNIWLEININVLPDIMGKILNLLSPDGKESFKIPSIEELAKDHHYKQYLTV